MADPASYRPAPGTIPTRPGVYRFRDPHGRVVYVGKAKSLRSRLSSYFQNPAGLHPRTFAMVTTAASVEWTVVRNEVEALILEHTWIKEFDPRFNVDFKDDKSYPYLAITVGEEIPRITVMRGARKPGVRYFGPYAHAWAIRDTVDTLLTALPMRSCTKAIFNRASRDGRPCLLGYIGKCSAPCVGRVSAEEHRATVDKVMSVLGGDAKGLIRDLTEHMEAAAGREEYEAAARYRDRLRALTDVLDRSAIVLDPGTNADIIGLVNDDMEAAAHLFRVRDGRITGERGWVIDKPDPLDDAALLTQLVQEAYADAEPIDLPTEVLLPVLPAEHASLSEWLSGVRGATVAVRSGVRSKRADLARTAKDNAQHSLDRHRLKRSQDITARSRALQELHDSLGLAEAPLRIECYDISHTQGEEQVGSMVVFEDALPRKKEYRLFKVRDAADDTAAMAEVLTRRFKRYVEDRELSPQQRGTTKFAYPPQLVVVDGGAPQVASARRALDALQLHDIPVVGLAKRLEELWLPGEEFPVVLPRGSEGLYLLQRVRDEAHRTAITFHRKRRGAKVKTSSIREIPGVGAVRTHALLRHFGSLERLKSASVEQIALVPGIGDGTAATIYAAIRGGDGMLET